jgi:hypothetical protein
MLSGRWVVAPSTLPDGLNGKQFTIMSQISYHNPRNRDRLTTNRFH